MAENSGIEWTHHTFNPWIGCTKVSAACDHCYAEAWDKRFGGQRWGPHAPRKRTKTWGNPVKWNRQAEAEGRRFRVFCASLADVFDNDRSITSGWRGDLWHLIHRTPQLDWLLLTKRPQNIPRFLRPEEYGPLPAWGNGWPNVWLGTTVENQAEAERRLPHLCSFPAAVRFISAEPLLGPIDLRAVKIGHATALSRLDWVITGGESGALYRPADPEWFRGLRDQCATAGIPFLFKQWEGRSQREIKAKGRALDGVVHDGYPSPESDELFA
ncbi:MAG: phage Gp37/Gp68 family protein [Devosia sp.]